MKIKDLKPGDILKLKNSNWIIIIIINLYTAPQKSLYANVIKINTKEKIIKFRKNIYIGLRESFVDYEWIKLE